MRRILYAAVLLALIVQPASAFVLMGERTALFEKNSYTLSGIYKTRRMDYYLLRPKNYDPKQSYPLVVSLHGGSGHSWAGYVLATPEMQTAYPTFVLVPYDPMVNSWTGDETQPLVTIKAIIDKVMKSYKSIDPSRIYLTGYSMGGYGTFQMVADNPDFFAAAVPLCGGGDVNDAPKMVSTPMWIFHGALDDNIPVDQSRKMVAAIKAAGGSPIYTEYPTMKHDVWNHAYEYPKFWQWLFSQKRP